MKCGCMVPVPPMHPPMVSYPHQAFQHPCHCLSLRSTSLKHSKRLLHRKGVSSTTHVIPPLMAPPQLSHPCPSTPVLQPSPPSSSSHRLLLIIPHHVPLLAPCNLHHPTTHIPSPSPNLPLRSLPSPSLHLTLPGLAGSSPTHPVPSLYHFPVNLPASPPPPTHRLVGHTHHDSLSPSPSLLPLPTGSSSSTPSSFSHRNLGRLEGRATWRRTREWGVKGL